MPSNKLGKQNLIASVLIGITTFCLYTCMYAVRKPFSALVYDNQLLWGANIKIWMVLAQLLGYTLSKFYGIKKLGTIKKEDRSVFLLIVLVCATIPLFVMQFADMKFWPLLMFLNGFPLGLVWGIVFSYVEGRRFTELIGAMLACTFVFSSGWVKSFGLYLQNALDLLNSEVPFYTAIIALILAAITLLLLEKLPTPTQEDIQLRNHRTPLTPVEQKNFLHKYGSILLPFVFIYGTLTILRDFRDNFSAELLTENHAFSTKVFTQMEFKVTLILLAIIPLFSLIKSHKSALIATNYSILGGAGVSILSTYLFIHQYIDITTFLMCSGAGFYLGYILINISVMDRLIGYSGQSANSGFLIYIADSVGYLFSLLISSMALLFKDSDAHWTNLYIYILLIGSIATVVISLIIINQINKQKTISTNATIIPT